MRFAQQRASADTIQLILDLRTALSSGFSWAKVASIDTEKNDVRTCRG